MAFAYRARDESGALVTGEIQADSVEAVRDHLSSQGLIPLAVHSASKKGFSLDALRDLIETIPPEEIMVFTRQFYTLFKAGVSVDSILDTLSKQGLNFKLQKAVEQIQNEVRRGASLSQAFRQQPKVFSELYVSMIAAGEEAGILEDTLLELCELITKEEQIKKAVKGALFYPKIVVFALAGSITTLMIMVVPKFEQFFRSMNADLPVMTKLLISMSNFMVDFWYIALLGVVGSIVGFKRYAKTRSGRFRIDMFKFQVPVFGALTLKSVNARFGRIVSALYKSGLPMARSLEVVSRVLENEAFSLEVRLLIDDIQRGLSLGAAMAKRQYFPPIMVETTTVGERSGALDEMLEAIATHYEMEVDHTVKNLTALIEPILLGVIFAVVTVVALAIFMPMWQITQI